MNEKKKTFINLIAAAIAFASGVLINFFLAPYIVKHIGVAAYGFILMANDFVSYLAIVTLAINSMASRFITIAMHQGKAQEAEEYYSSTIGANICLAVGLLAIASPIVFQLEKFINIPLNLIGDVKGLFSLYVINFLITIIFSAYATGYIIKNKLFLSSIVQMKGNMVRMLLLISLFYVLPPHVSYMGIGALAATFLTKIYDIFYQRRLVPELSFRWISFKWNRCREMLASGIWNVITRIGNLLSVNLDLLLVNVLLTPADMGILAITKIAPNFLTTITGIMAGVYMPDFLRLYATQKYDELVLCIKESMKIFSIILGIPLVILLSLGNSFFQLWLPGQDSHQLYILSVFMLFNIIVIGPVALMHNIFTVVNRVKTNSILIVFSGLLAVLGGWGILRYTEAGLYGIAIWMTSTNLFRNLLYTVPYGAKYLYQSIWTFFPILIKFCICVSLVSSLLYQIFGLLNINTWFMFAICSVIASMVFFIIQIVIVLNKQERKKLLKILQSKVGNYL